jgi:hypothetical protein
VYTACAMYAVYTGTLVRWGTWWKGRGRSAHRSGHLRLLAGRLVSPACTRCACGRRLSAVLTPDRQPDAQARRAAHLPARLGLRARAPSPTPRPRLAQPAPHFAVSATCRAPPRAALEPPPVEGQPSRREVERWAQFGAAPAARGLGPGSQGWCQQRQWRAIRVRGRGGLSQVDCSWKRSSLCDRVNAEIASSLRSRQRHGHGQSADGAALRRGGIRPRWTAG